MKPKQRTHDKTVGIHYTEDKNDELRTCSTMDCTGLIPAGMTEEEMVDAYNELYPFLPSPIVPEHPDECQGKK